MNSGKVFLGAVFLLISIYLFLYESSPSTRLIGGGILGILGILSLYAGLKEK